MNKLIANTIISLGIAASINASSAVSAPKPQNETPTRIVVQEIMIDVNKDGILDKIQQIRAKSLEYNDQIYILFEKKTEALNGLNPLEFHTKLKNLKL